MALNVIPVIDHKELVEDSIATQYREAYFLKGHIKALLEGTVDLEQVFQDIIVLLDIDTATGAQLDLIGRIVGQPRSIAILDGVFFTFDPLGDITQPENYGFGDSPDPAEEPETGGIFRSEGESAEGSLELPDALYRIFIKAKILNNHALSTPEEVIYYFRVIFEWEPVLIRDGFRFGSDPNNPATDEVYSANAIIESPRQISNLELLVLQNLPPKTVGVSFQYTSTRGGLLPILDPAFPQDITAANGQMIVFRVVELPGGLPVDIYQWYQDGQQVGSNDSFYGVQAVFDMNGHLVYCEATNEVGTVTSRVATLTVTEPLWIDSEPWDDDEAWPGS